MFLLCPTLDAMGCFVGLLLGLLSELYASCGGVGSMLLGRIDGIARLMKSLLFHSHRWVGVSRLVPRLPPPVMPRLVKHMLPAYTTQNSRAH